MGVAISALPHLCLILSVFHPIHLLAKSDSRKSAFGAFLSRVHLVSNAVVRCPVDIPELEKAETLLRYLRSCVSNGSN